MRILFIAIIITCSFSLHSQSVAIYKSKALEPAEFIVTYSLEFKNDSLNLDNVGKEDMLLLLGKNISLFASKNNYIAMNQLNNLTSAEQRQKWVYNNLYTLISRFKYRIFKNYPKGNLTCTEHILGPSYLYNESLELFNWQLTDDTATVAGYKAQKAITEFGGRSWIAWFSPEIPFNDGPYKFNGLPGLIVKVYDTRMHYLFDLKSIEKSEKELMIEFAEMEYLETTKQDFFRAEDTYKEDIINRVKESGGSSEDQQYAARRMAERNNPIELKRK